jgi:hypothetical protein
VEIGVSSRLVPTNICNSRLAPMNICNSRLVPMKNYEEKFFWFSPERFST